MTIKEFYEKYGDVELTEEQEKHIKKYLKIKDKRWKPNIDNKYYYISSTGFIDNAIAGIGHLSHYRYLTNNMFKTEEEAKFYFEKLNVYYELKLFADENNEEMDLLKGENLYCIEYSTYNECLDVNNYVVLDIGQIYFSSKEIAEKAIEKVGASRIKKYLFEVK